jgi:hypothetical protein
MSEKKPIEYQHAFYMYFCSEVTTTHIFTTTPFCTLGSTIFSSARLEAAEEDPSKESKIKTWRPRKDSGKGGSGEGHNVREHCASCNGRSFLA